MARRKRLNKRFVVLLVSAGALLALLVVTGVIWLLPEDPDRLAQHAQMMLAEGNYNLAVNEYGRAAQSAAQKSMNPERHFLALGEAMLEWRRKDPSLGQTQRNELFHKARAAFREAVRWDPKFVQAQRRLTETGYELARNVGNWEEYIVEADKLLSMVPEEHAVLYQRAQAKMALAQTRPEYIEPALADLRKLLRVAPQEEDYWVALAGFFARREGTDQTRRLIWVCPKDPQVREPRASGQMDTPACPICGAKMNAETAGAELTYKDGLKVVPDSVIIRVAYASYILSKDKQRKAEAEGLLVEAIERQPDKAAGYEALARFQMGQGQKEQAIKTLNRALARDPTEYAIYGMLAMAQSDPAEVEKVLMEGLAQIRKSLEDASSQASPQQVSRYRGGIMALDHMLADALLDRMRAGGPASVMEVRPRVEKALEEMRGLVQVHPAIDKIAGELALADGDYVEAERLLRQAYEAFSPGFEPKTAGLLIDLYRRQNQLGEAQKILQRYLALSENNPALMLNLAGLYLDYREYGQAERIVQEVLKAEPDNELAKSLGVSLKAVMAGADQLPPQLEKLDVYSARLFLQRAQQLWGEGEEQKAVALLEQLLAKDPRQRGVVLQLVSWLRLRKQDQQAEAVLDRVIAANKDSPETQNALEMLRETDPAKRMESQLAAVDRIEDPLRKAVAKADIYLAYGKREQFLAQLKEAEAKDPRNALVVERMFSHSLNESQWEAAGKYAAVAAEDDLDGAGGKYYQARLARARAKWDEAVKLISEVIQKRPRFSEAYAFRGDCYLAQSQLEPARADYEQAYKQNPTNVTAMVGMVMLTARTGESREHERWVERAALFAPTNPLIRESLVRLREAGDKPEEAIKVREQILRDQPEDVNNLFRLAVLYEKVGKLNNAEEAYRSAYALSKGAPWALRALSRFLYRTNRDVQARALLAKYAETAPDKLAASLIWADYLELAGELEQARSVHLKALETDEAGKAYEAIAAFLERQGKPAEAAEYQKKYLERAGKDAGPEGLRTLVRYLIDGEQYEQAEKGIDQGLAGNPSDYELLALKGLAHLEQDDLEKALQALNKALEISPQYVPALRFRAGVHMNAGRYLQAAKDLEAAKSAIGRASLRDALGLAVLYSRMNDFANAQAVLKAFLADQPDSPQALRVLAELCLSFGRWPAMEEALNEANRAFPKEPAFRELEGRMWLRRGQPPRAAAAFQAAMQLAPPQQQPALGLQLAQSLALAGQYAPALQRCQQLASDQDLAVQAKAIEGLIHAKQNNPAEAEKSFTAALKQAAPEQVGDVLAQVRLAFPAEVAIANIRRWAAVRPDDWQLPVAAGDMLLTHDNQAAVAEYLKALAKDPNDAAKWKIQRQLGVAYDGLGRYEDSRVAYEAALKVNPDDAGTLNNFAWLLAERLKNPAEALPYARRAAELMPGSAEVLDTYGLVLLQKGELNTAEEVLSRAVKIDAIAPALLHLGNVYEKLGRKDEALRQYQRGWETIKDNANDPLYKELRGAIDRLRGQP